MSAVPRRLWDLAVFYFFYFAWLGVLVPYASLWLDARGLNAVQIGIVMGAFIGTKMVAPALWGHLSDVTGYRVRWAQLAALLSGLLLAGWLWVDSFGAILLITVAFSFFYHAMLPQVEAITLARLHDKGRYGRIRLWGSVGFILGVLVAGPLLQRWGIAHLPQLLVAMAGVLFLSTLMLREADARVAVDGVLSLGEVLRKPAVLALLATTFLVTASHGVYYNFYSIALEQAGFDKTLISQLWAWAVAVEVGLFFIMHRLFDRWLVTFLLQVAVVLTGVRWVLNLLWPTDIPVQIIAQALHAASYALFHGAAITLIDRYFTGPVQVRGQGLYAAVSHGLGGGVGALLGGWLWHWGGGTLGYGVSILMVALAFWIFHTYGRDEHAFFTYHDPRGQS